MGGGGRAVARFLKDPLFQTVWAYTVEFQLSSICLLFCHANCPAFHAVSMCPMLKQFFV